MGKRMRRVDTADLLPGMITAEDVYDYNNQFSKEEGHGKPVPACI